MQKRHEIHLTKTLFFYISKYIFSFEHYIFSIKYFLPIKNHNFIPKRKSRLDFFFVFTIINSHE